jgi:hypothetical protein
VRESFDKQQVMRTLGARLTRVELRSGTHETPIATMLATIMTVMDRSDVVG